LGDGAADDVKAVEGFRQIIVSVGSHRILTRWNAYYVFDSQLKDSLMLRRVVDEASSIALQLKPTQIGFPI